MLYATLVFYLNLVKRYFLLTLFVLLFASVGFSQKNSVKNNIKSGDTLSLDTIARQVEVFLNDQLNQAISPRIVTDSALLHMLFSSGYGDVNMNDAYQALYESKIKALKGDVGLRLGGAYQENFKPGFSSEEDVAYMRRVYAGVEWDLLNSGLFANRSKIKSLEKDLEINQLEAERVSKENDYMFLYSYITYLFKKQKVELLAHRREVLNEQVLIGRKMYYLRATSWENLLELQSKAQEVEALRNNNQVYFNKRLKSGMPEMFMDDNMIYDHLPVFEIDPDKMIELFNTSGIDIRIQELRNQKYEAEYFRFNDYTLKPFVRYNIQQDENAVVKKYASVGLSASIPLKLGSRMKNELEAQRRIVENEEEIKRFGSGNEILNYYYEYQFKKMQYISFHFKKLLIEERLRKELVMRDFNDEAFSPLRALQILDEKFSIEIEMVDIKKDMYLKMLKIYTYLDVKDPNTFINVINPEELGIRYKGHRNLYIWSEMFNKMENEHLLAFLRNNEIKEVLLSPGREFNNEKVSDFVYKAYAQKIKVHLMIGENSLLSNDAAVVLKQRFELVKGLPLEGIHLDVEPQALDDYKQNRQAYHDKLVSVLTDAKTLCITENYKLSASVPLSFEISELSRIYELCDKVYLMAYEHPDLDYIKRKTADAISVSAEKSIIALSPSDFTDRLSMELFIEKMVQEMGVHQIAIHDLRRLIEIDNRSIQKVN